MLQRSKFSNKVLIGLMSLGFVGTVAVIPTVGRADTHNSSSDSLNHSQVSQSLKNDSSNPDRVESSATERTPDADRTSPERSNSDDMSSDYDSQSQSQNNPGSSATGAGYGSTERDGSVRTPYQDRDELDQSQTQGVDGTSSGSMTSPGSTNSTGTVRSQSQTTSGSASETGSSADGRGQGVTERDGSVRTPTNNYPQTGSQSNTQDSTTQDSTTQSADTSNETIEAVVEGNDSFNTLATAIKAAGLQETLNSEGPYTIFAPTDEAFAAIPPETLQQLLLPENQQVLRQILSYHVVPGNMSSTEIQSGQVNTVEGSAVDINTAAGNVTVSGANVVQPDIAANNGVIHAIDRVLLPPSLQR
jgi:uncharacterized surface protein with fasciclin (FAS1) repeats